MKASKIIFLLLLFSLGGCRTTYNYYLILPEREESKPAEVKYHYPRIDRWNPVEVNEMLNKIKIEL